MISESSIFHPIDNRIYDESVKTEKLIQNFQNSFDQLVHEPKRLSILLVLTQNPLITFSALQKLLETTSGNLTNHLKHLVKESLVKTNKSFVNTRPCTVISITEIGLERLKEYQSKIEALFSSINF